MSNVTEAALTVSGAGTTTTVPELPVIVPAELSRSAYNFLAAYTGFLTIVGIFNNGMVIYLFTKFPHLRQPVNIFLLNLSISDMSVSLLASPLTFASNVAGYWLFGQIGCSIYAFVVMIGGFEQIAALTAVSIHRCFLVVRPFTAKKMTMSWAVFFVSLTWLYSFILTIPPAFGWNEFVPEGAGTACSVNWTESKPGNTSYVIFIFVMVLAVPLSTLVFSYGLLIFAVKKQISASEAAQSTENKAEGRVTKMVVVMVFFFLFAWTPYAVFALLVAFGNTHVSPLVATLPAFFAKSCTIYNPILYFVLNRQFRDAFYEFIGYQPPEEPDNSGQRQNRNINSQQPGANQRQNMQRTASVATVMSELPSVRPDAFRSSGQFLAGGKVDPTGRALSKTYKTSAEEDSSRLAPPLPGQSVEMTENLKGFKGSEDTDREKHPSDNPNDPSFNTRMKSSEPPRYSEVEKGGHVNEGYQMGAEAGKTVFVHRVKVKSANGDDEDDNSHRKDDEGMPNVEM
ncbi:Pineal opsin [Holothuria leucospilota]|uniref:Pineal opsin n=1 Tax=Holothuria leucospilota TaxID=206669 RepID=A0A9Q1CFM4_HOLLE|nr:Pineal opsin [Holothuria leucospilota]